MNKNKQISIIEKWAKKKDYTNKLVIINIFLNIVSRTNKKHLLYDKTWNQFQVEEIQHFLLCYTLNELNEIATFYSEKTVNQKESGSFYTPKDVVDHIVKGMLSKNTTKNPLIIDPTAGSGAFLEGVLGQWENFYCCPEEVVKNLHANDTNEFSLKVWKQKLWIWCLLNNVEEKYAKSYIEKNTTLHNALKLKGEYDIFIGNPPYFEVRKADGYSYGNIYAEILVSIIRNNAKPTSLFGFIVPISFQTTKRMGKVRKVFLEKYNSYIISSFADRPSCIFPGIHQKLNIIQFWNKNAPTRKTTSYLQFNSEKRKTLFNDLTYANNSKLNLMIGKTIERKIFQKITKTQESKYIFKGDSNVYVSQRITHWSKAFPYKQLSKEYIPLPCKDKKESFVLAALLTSDIYFFFWAVASDGWHNTKGTLEKFFIPKDSLEDSQIFTESKKLFDSLEKNKKEINTVQSKFSYVHRKSDKFIRKIDELFAKYYGFNNEELNYIKNYLKEIR